MRGQNVAAEFGNGLGGGIDPPGFDPSMADLLNPPGGRSDRTRCRYPALRWRPKRLAKSSS